MYPPEQHNTHPFLPVFLDALEDSAAANVNGSGSGGIAEGYGKKSPSEYKFLTQLLFGHIFNKEVLSLSFFFYSFVIWNMSSI